MSLVAVLQASLASVDMTREPIVQLFDEWRSVRCVCGEEKWKNFPFCRRCSIRIERVGLMEPIKYCRGSSLEVAIRDEAWALRWARAYDRARDYLVTCLAERGSWYRRCVAEEEST